MLERFWTPRFGLESSFAELDRMRRDMERLFEGLSGSGSLWPARAGVFPPVNVAQDHENYYIRAELPGLKAGDIEVTTNHSSLGIAGKRAVPRDDKVSYHRCERPEGEFRRSVTLPGEFQAAKIDARHVNGVLTITLPKAEATKPNQIAVKAS